MLDLLIPCPAPFHFEDVALSHGWLRLAPYEWDEATRTLARVELLREGAATRMELTAAPGGVRLRSPAPAEAAPELVARARWVLALDDDLAGFHAMCGRDPGLAAAGRRGQGRILRCPTVWEDLVKTLFTVNTTWRQTIAMTRQLVTRYGEPHADGGRAFPRPEAVAAADAEELQRECRVGYRARPLSLLARAAAEGELDLDALKNPALSTAEVEERLRALPGIGPYAAANMLMLLGRCDHLPVDSWFRKTVRQAWFQGRPVPDRELVAAFEPYRPYRALAYLFYDWEGAMRTETWRRES